jgi:hypothetical protein
MGVKGRVEVGERCRSARSVQYVLCYIRRWSFHTHISSVYWPRRGWQVYEILHARDDFMGLKWNGMGSDVNSGFCTYGLGMGGLI